MTRHQQLRERLSDWTYVDDAMLILAQCIGLIPPEMSFSDGLSGLFHSSNPISEALFAFLQGLVRAGVLEAQKNEFRWNQAFRGEWLDDS